MIEIRHLSKKFGNLTVLRDVNATIRTGEIVSIIGPSGTGKSTFLRCLNLLEKPTGGEVIVDGMNLLAPHADIPHVRMKMGMVFQQFNLFPHLTVLENITISPRRLLKVSRAEAEKEALELLRLVGLENKAFALPQELSGGQQQRVAIARTLAMHPKVILFDEPTSALDPTMVDEVLEVISQLAKTGITMIIVTHEMRFAQNISTRIFYMDEGIIYEDGTPEQIFETPKKPRTIAFIKRIDMKYFHLNRHNYDSEHLRSLVNSMLERYQVLPKDSKDFTESILKILNEVIFPLSDEVELRVGIFKGNKQPSYGVIWNGAMVNPLENPSESLKKCLGIFEQMDFSEDITGRPRLRFLLRAKKEEN